MPAGEAPAERARQARVPGALEELQRGALAWSPDSWVARNAEPIWTPSAPRASAAAMPRASAMPPAATTGARTSSATTATSGSVPTSESSARSAGTRRGARRPRRPRRRSTSTPASSSATASSGVVAVPSVTIPRSRGASSRPGVRDAEDEAERGRGARQHRLGLLVEARGEALGERRRLGAELVVERPQPADRGGEALAASSRPRADRGSRPRGSARRARRCAAQLLGDVAIAAGSRWWTPNEPRPPASDTAAASSTLDRPPPNGPRMIGWRRPRRSRSLECAASGAAARC